MSVRTIRPEPHAFERTISYQQVPSLSGAGVTVRGHHHEHHQGHPQRAGGLSVCVPLVCTEGMYVLRLYVLG